MFHSVLIYIYIHVNDIVTGRMVGLPHDFESMLWRSILRGQVDDLEPAVIRDALVACGCGRGGLSFCQELFMQVNSGSLP